MKQIITLVMACLYVHANTYSQTPNRFDVVIDELMADPYPPVALPNYEWIELKNSSAAPVNLQGCRLANLSRQSGPMPNFVLRPDSFVIVCTASAVPALSAYGKTIAVTGFPSLINTGDRITLINARGMVIHCVYYTDAWYQNDLKKSGGWSLEMIDTRNPCSGISNWKASTDAKGGTPGRKNSTDAINPDRTPPRLLRAYATDSVHITLVFDEPLDSLSAAQVTAYQISDGIGQPASANPQAPVFDHVNLRTTGVLLVNKVYAINVRMVTDCAGNPIGAPGQVYAGLPSPADSLDLVINEILFDPVPMGVDYVEIYNRSKKIIDLKKVSIANRNSSGAVSSITPLSMESYLLFPGSFMVVTTNASVVKRNYITLNPDAFAEVGSMPSFNNDQGDVIILNEQGRIIDELVYSANWHFKLITNPQGVALERIDYNASTPSPDNWHSAAASAGYGTPTYKNSQYRSDLALQGEINVSPGIVSPDNDGMDDFETIAYQFPAPGYVANITIFDASGRIVRYLQRNAICGTNGNFRWDGLGERNKALPVGIYIIYTDVFNLEGKRKQFKNVVVLARKHG